MKNHTSFQFIVSGVAILVAACFTPVGFVSADYLDTWNYADSSSLNPSSGYIDTWNYADSSSLNPGYVDTWNYADSSSLNPGYVDTWNYADSSSLNPSSGYIDTWNYADSSPLNTGYDSLTYRTDPDYEDYTVTRDTTSTYTTQTQGTTYSSNPSIGYLGSGLSLGFSYGSSYPTSYGYSSGSYYPYTVSAAPVATRSTSGSTPSVGWSNMNYSSNTCTGNSCNTSTVVNKYIDNSINGSLNTYDSGNTIVTNSGNTSVTSPATVSTLKTVSSYPAYYPVQYTSPSYSYYQPYYYPAPTYPSCSISSTPNPASAGQAVTLTWTSTNAGTAYLFGGSVNTSGSTTVYPTQTTTYELTVYSTQGIVGRCQTTAQVGTYITPTYIAPQPTTPYVSLTQIPYTGFDYGTIGNSIYWLSILAFAVAASYLLLYYRGGTRMVLGSLGVPRTVAAKAPATPAIFAAYPAAPKREVPTASHSVAAYKPKDSMTLVRSENGAAPKIVINRA